MRKLEGKNALVTGAALGMGRCLSRLLLEEGMRVALFDIRTTELAQAKEDLGRLGDVAAYRCDISDRQAVYDAARLVRREFGPVDLLLNNAGIVGSHPFLQKPDEWIEKTIAVNLLSIFWTTKAFLPDMLSKGEGHVVNMASAGGLLGVPYITDYSATKFAVVGLTESLRQEMKLSGHRKVRFTYVCPNTVDTGMFRGARPVKGTKLLLPEEVAVKILKGIKRNKGMIGIPGSVYTVPLIKAVMPIPAMDFLNRVLGISTSSETTTGRVDL